MIVDYNTALDVYERLPDDPKSPYLHPYYITSDAARDPSLEPLFFVYRDNREVFYHAFHRGRVEGTPYSDIQSPYAYGGPLASTSDPEFLSRAWKEYLSWCRESNILAEFVRFHPLLENWRCYPGEVQYQRETVWIDLQSGDIFSSFSPRVRTAIRKANSNRLRVEWVDSSHCYQFFADFYTRAMEFLNAGRSYFFSADYFRKLKDWPHSHLAFCLRDKEVLAAALFLIGPPVMEYHLAAASSEGKKLCASSLLLDQAAALGKELGCRILHLGGGTDNRPDNSLLFFKSGFSQKRSCFKTGRFIHRPGAYKKIQLNWQEKHGVRPEKTLFYRFPRVFVSDLSESGLSKSPKRDVLFDV